MSQEFNAGQRLGDYEILSVLGTGGMGKVYKVRNTISDRVEAMKILLPNLSSQQELANRFLREIKLLASLNHPNIAQLRTALTIDNQLVMIMEFVDGFTIAARLQDGPLAPATAVNYADQVLDALSYAHKQNIVHRDVKPANMMVTPHGVVKLMDFGIARSASDRGLTMTGTTLGSLNYMPPEQVKGEPADARSDLYSLGVALYEMVTDRLPFQGDSSYSLMAAHLNEQPKPPNAYCSNLPETLNQIILMAMEKDPARRFQSADAFRNALKSVGGGASVATQPAAPAMTPVPRHESPTLTGETLVPRSASASQATQMQSAGGVAGTGSTELFSQGATGGSATTLGAGPSAPATGSTPLFANTPVPAHTGNTSGAIPSGAGQIPRKASSSHRGLYVALGGLLVVGCLAAAAFVLPRHSGAKADARKASFPSQQQAPEATTPSNAQTPQSSTPDSVSVTPSGVSTTTTNPDGSKTSVDVSPTGGVQITNTPPPAQSPSASATATPGNAGSGSAASAGEKSRVSRHAHASSGASAQQQQPSASSTSGNATAQSQQASAADEALAEAVEKQNDEVGSRAEAVTQSIDNLKQQDAAQGYGLRGDIVASEARMNAYYSRAQEAMNNNDPKSAKKYLDLAEAELEKLEKFLGR
jgi:eukaryotic-like serine/threonine-protein kinase